MLLYMLQVASFLDTFAFGGVMQYVRRAAGSSVVRPSGADASQQPDSQAASGSETDTLLLHRLLSDLAAFVTSYALEQSPDMLVTLVETCVEVTSSNKVAVQPAAGGRKGASNRTVGSSGSVSEAAYAVLTALLQQHQRQQKPPTQQAVTARVMYALLPVLLGMHQSPTVAAAKRGAGVAAEARGGKRAVGVAFVLGMNSWNASALATTLLPLLQQLCIRPQDKADSRHQAVQSIATLAPLLTALQRQALTVYVLRLSKSGKVAHRMMAVEVAHTLLVELDGAFTPSSEYQALLQPAAAVGACDSCSAPWGTVCLAVLCQRLNDKAAAVRGKALSCLGDSVDTYTRQRPGPSFSHEQPQGRDTAPPPTEGHTLLLALSAAPHCTLIVGRAQPRQRILEPGSESDPAGPAARAAKLARQGGANGKGTGAPRAWACGGGEGEGAAGSARGAATRGKAALVVGAEAVLPLSRTKEGLDALLGLCRSRGCDDKAGVRKAAMQLLPALLVLRGTGSPGATPLLPSDADLLAIERAAGDPLVSVRKAALLASSALLRTFPTVSPIAELWVRCALPLIRDPEASVQEAVIELTTTLLLNTAAASAGLAKAVAAAGGAATGGRGRRQPPGADGAAAAAAAAAARCLLSALAVQGKGAASCMAKLFGLLAAKKALPAKAVARGLEALLSLGGARGQAPTAAHPAAVDGAAPAAAMDCEVEDGGSTHDAAAAAAGAGAVAASARVLTRDEALGCWMLLREVAVVDPGAPSWAFLQSAWGALQAQRRSRPGAAGAAAAAARASESGEEEAALLWVVSHSALKVPAGEAERLAKSLLQAMLRFDLPASAISAHVAALHRLTSGGSSSGSSSAATAKPAADSSGAIDVDAWEEAGLRVGAVGSPKTWSLRMMEAAAEALRQALGQGKGAGSSGRGQSSSVAAALVSIGEVALLRAASVPSGVVLLVQAMTAEPSSSQTQAQAASQAVPIKQEDGSDTAAAAPELPPLGGADAAGSASQQQQPHQGLAWAALGKLCMVDETLAKKCLPLMVQELTRSRQPAVRLALLVTLCDLAVSTTSLVDPHIPRLAAATGDPHELVRCSALALLSDLLMKDYVKWRGSLFHRFCLSLVDTSPDVRSLGKHLLGSSLATKAPLLALNHFIETLFVLNDRPGAFAKLQTSQRGGVAGTAGAGEGGGPADSGIRDHVRAAGLVGGSAEARASRDAVYQTLLERMAGEHKFALSAKLVSEILTGVVDNALSLEEGGEVLGDALRLLACKEIRGLARAKGRLVSALMKKHLVESVVPLIIELKHMLQLAKEILYDLRQAEADAAMAARAASLPAAPAAQSTAAVAAAAATAGVGSGVPPPAPRDSRRQSLPPGVSPGTPLTAAVLLQSSRLLSSLPKTSGPASAAASPRRGAPATAAVTAVAKTPCVPTARSRLSAGLTPGLAGGLLLPRTPNTLSRQPTAAGGGRPPHCPSPAPLINPASALRAPHRPPTTQEPSLLPPAPTSSANTHHGATAVTVTTVPLPSPLPGQGQPLRQWNVNLPEREPKTSSAGAGDGGAKPTTRGKAAAAGEGNARAPAPAPAPAPAGGGAENEGRPGGRRGKASAQQPAAAAAVAGVAAGPAVQVKLEAGAAEGEGGGEQGKARSRKSKRGGAAGG
ncbi:MAG: hypothetical protein WDW38_002613 [Sanguina aurantia]